jgi:hypothetical protein
MSVRVLPLALLLLAATLTLGSTLTAPTTDSSLS